MNGHDGKRFRLGLFVLAAMVLLGVLIVLFGESPTWFRQDLTYVVKVAAAAGVEQGTPVRKSGVKIGEVVRLDLDLDSGEVSLHIRVEKRFQLRKGDKAILARNFVLGDTALNFVPEGQDRTPAERGHVFKGQPPGDLGLALGKATELLPLAQETMEQIRVTAKSMNETMPELRRTLAEAQVAMNNFGKASESADNLIRGNQEKITKTVDQFQVATGRMVDLLSDENQRHVQAALRNLRQASDRLDGFMKNGEALMKNTEATMKNVDQVVRNADGLVTDTRQAVKQVTQQADTVGKGAEELIKDGRATMKRVNESLGRADEALVSFQQLAKQLNERTPVLLKNVEEGTVKFNQLMGDGAEFVRTLTAGEGSLRRLVTDPALFNNMNDLAGGLNRSAARFDRILRDLELFADKVARHPELLGVSGAVSPSSGIKR